MPISRPLLTNYGEPGPSNQWRIGGNQALIDALVRQLGKLDLQFPVVGLFVEDLKPRIAAVSRQAKRQQMRGVTVAFQPGDLQHSGK